MRPDGPELSQARVRPDASLRIAPNVVHREFPAQTVVLNLNSGRYYGLNPTAGQMLTVLEESTSVAAAARTFADRHRQPRESVERDLCQLCERLLERGLVEFVGGSPAQPARR